MELSLFPHKEDTVYAFPWAFYRKEGPYYLAGCEKAEVYLPYIDVNAHLRAVRDEGLWDLVLQDSIKEILSILLLDGFHEETALPRALEGLKALLSVFPGHSLSRALREELAAHDGNPWKAAAWTVARWNEIRRCNRSDKRIETVGTLGPVDACLDAYPFPIRPALERLTAIIRDSSSYFYGAYLHGSLATLDFVPGTSDLDLVYILGDDVAQDPFSLLEIRRLLKDTRSCFYAVDRLQHHGPYVLTPQMTRSYLECYLPLAAWRKARSILGPDTLSFDVSESSFHQQVWFRRSVQFYRRNSCEGKALTTIYDAKLLVSMATLLPSLAHAFLTGRYLCKVESLKWLVQAFPDVRVLEWVHQLSRIRSDGLCRATPSQMGMDEMPDRTSPIPPELSQGLGSDPFLPVAEICDRVLGILGEGISPTPFRTYFNLPKAAGQEAYAVLGRKISDSLRSLQGVTRVLLSGTVGTPGISDLDFTIVTEDRLPRDTAEKIRAIQNTLKHEEKALMMHPPMGVVPEQLLPYLPWVFPVHIDRTLWGPEPVFHPLSNDEHLLLILVQLTDLAIAMNGRLFQEMVRRKEMDVRLLLNTLAGLKYTAAMVEEAGGTQAPFQPFLASIEGLRSQWFEETRLRDLPDFLHQGLRFVESINRQIALLWQQQAPLSPETCSYRAQSTGADFAENVDETGWNIEGEEIAVRLPLVFGIPLKHYAALDGPLSSFIRKHLKGDPMEQQGRVGEVLTRRAGFLNSHFEFLIRNELRIGFFAPFHFGWRLDGRSRQWKAIA